MKILSFLLVFLLFSGCTSQKSELSRPNGSSAGENAGVVVSGAAYGEDPSISRIEEEALFQNGIHPYVQQLLQTAANDLIEPEMSEYERVKAAFDYMIIHTAIEEPEGLSLWRIHGGGDQPIPFLEQRALSPLRFGVGMCEDYAAALTLLLREMGLDAEYVPGLTYSAEGNLVDHAWTMVKIDEVWYHLDSQLEDNISRRGSVRYKYFLRGDATLSASHRWGQNLIDSGLLTAKQNAEIAQSWLTPSCPQDYPRPDRSAIPDGAALDLEGIKREAEKEIAVWEAENGPLPEMELNTTPPVFGLEGYGPADEG